KSRPINSARKIIGAPSFLLHNERTCRRIFKDFRPLAGLLACPASANILPSASAEAEMNAGDIWKVVAGGGSVVAGGVAPVGLFFVNPYGPLQPRPDVCAAQQTCVIVAGLYHDVNIGFGANGQPFGMDPRDEMRSQLIAWITDARQDIRLYRLPEEIATPRG